MNNSKKFFIVSILLLLFSFNFVLGATGITNPDSPKMPNSSVGVTKVETATGNIWTTFSIIAQIAAIAAIVFAGLRYMLTSADHRADIKMQTIILIGGAVLVFAAVPFAKFVAAIFDNLL